VPGGIPQTTVTSSQFDGTVTWSPNDSPFKSRTAYTATITLTAKSPYTVSGVAKDFFKVDYARTSNNAGSGVVTAVFLATGGSTGDEAPVTPTIITDIAPKTDGTPVRAIDEQQFSGTITWNPAAVFFQEGVIYAANIELTEKEGYTLVGVTGSWNVPGATSATLDGRVLNVVFPVTSASQFTPINIREITFADPVPGEAAPTTINATAQFTGTIVWDKLVTDELKAGGTLFNANTMHTATIRLVAASGYTLAGVGDNFFKVNGNEYKDGDAENPATGPTYVAGSGLVAYTFKRTAKTVTTKIIKGIPVPVAGEPAPLAINAIDNTQFTGNVTWDPEITDNKNGEFEAGKKYTAIINLVARKEWTFFGVDENYFRVDGVGTLPTNAPNSGVVTITYPTTAGDGVDVAVDDYVLRLVNPIAMPQDLAAPDPEEARPTIGTDDDSAPAQGFLFRDSYQYKIGAITWKLKDGTAPAASGLGPYYAPGEIYTATFIVVPKEGYQLDTIPANTFKVWDGKKLLDTSHVAGSGNVTVVFDAVDKLSINDLEEGETPDRVKIQRIYGVTAPTKGGTPPAVTGSITFDTTANHGPVVWDSATITWDKPFDLLGKFKEDTQYTAQIKLKPKNAYKLDMDEDFFVAADPSAGNESNIFASAVAAAGIDYDIGEGKLVPMESDDDEINPRFAGDTVYVKFQPTAGTGLSTVLTSPALKAIPGVTPPKTGATPVTTTSKAPYYDATINWYGEDGALVTGHFDQKIKYTAQITLTARSPYTFDSGVTANFLTVADSSPPATHPVAPAVGSKKLIVTASFLATLPKIDPKIVLSVPAKGVAPDTTVSNVDDSSYGTASLAPSTVTWSPIPPSPSAFAGGQDYTATITININDSIVSLSDLPPAGSKYFYIDGAPDSTVVTHKAPVGNTIVVTAVFKSTFDKVSNTLIDLNIPVAEDEIQTTIKDKGDQYTGIVTWYQATAATLSNSTSPMSSGDKFVGDKAYTAVIVLSDADSKYTLEGLASGKGSTGKTPSPFQLATGTPNSIEYFAAASTTTGGKSVEAKTIVVDFKAIAKKTLTGGIINGFPHPVEGASAPTTISLGANSTDGFGSLTGISWKQGSSTATFFEAGKPYTVVFTLNAATGYQFNVPANTTGITPNFTFWNDGSTTPVIPGDAKITNKVASNKATVEITIVYPTIIPDATPRITGISLGITGVTAPVGTTTPGSALGTNLLNAGTSVTSTSDSNAGTVTVANGTAWKKVGSTPGVFDSDVATTDQFTAGTLYRLPVTVTVTSTHSLLGTNSSVISIPTGGPVVRNYAVTNGTPTEATFTLEYTAVLTPVVIDGITITIPSSISDRPAASSSPVAVSGTVTVTAATVSGSPDAAALASLVDNVTVLTNWLPDDTTDTAAGTIVDDSGTTFYRVKVTVKINPGSGTSNYKFGTVSLSGGTAVNSGYADVYSAGDNKEYHFYLRYNGHS